MGFGASHDAQVPGSMTSQTLAGRFKVATISTPPPSPPDVDGEIFTGNDNAFGFQILDPFGIGSTAGNIIFPTRPPRRVFQAFRGSNQGDQFFEKIYLLPRSIDAGIILSDQVVIIDLYSSFRTVDRSWTAYDDSGAGQGVDIDSSPPPTVVFPPHSGATRTLTISLNGPTAINSTLDFTFDIPGLLQIPIIGTRSVLFPIEPEQPIQEMLEFLTDVMVARSGKEQRRALRKNPRVVYGLTYKTEGRERRLLENLIFDGQDRAFGVPIWFEPTALEAPIAINDTTITIGTTAAADYRDDGLAVVWIDAFTFEALQVASFTATTITFSSPFLSAFPVGARVMPVRTALMMKRVSQSKRIKNLQTDRISFRVIDNDINIASTAAFNSYDGRVLLDGPNFVDGQSLKQILSRNIQIIDNGTGSPAQFTDQPVSRIGSAKGFVTTDRGDLQDVRNLLHALKGKQVSFYLSTFYDDFDPVADIGPTDQSIDVSDVSYSDSVQSRQPRNVIRIHKTDGTFSDPKLVTGASKPSPGVERLSISPDDTGITALIADVERIEYIEKVRLDSDIVRITHLDGNGTALVTFPVKTVLEEDD